jgi:hypothetical protein
MGMLARTTEVANSQYMPHGDRMRDAHAYSRSRRTNKERGSMRGFTELRRNGTTAQDRRGLMPYQRGDGRGDGRPDLVIRVRRARCLAGGGSKSCAMGIPLLVHVQVCRYER